MKQTTWEQSDWTYFLVFLQYHTARRPETRFRVGWVLGRCKRAHCAREVYISYERASWVNCGGFGRPAAFRAEARDAILTRMGLEVILAVALRSRGL